MVDGAALVQLHALAEPGAAGRGDGHRDGDLVLGLRGLLRRLRYALAGGVGGLGLDGAEIVDVERLARGLKLGQGDQGAEALLGGEGVFPAVEQKAVLGAVDIPQQVGHDAAAVGARHRLRVHARRHQTGDDHGVGIGVGAVRRGGHMLSQPLLQRLQQYLRPAVVPAAGQCGQRRAGAVGVAVKLSAVLAAQQAVPLGVLQHGDQCVDLRGGQLHIALHVGQQHIGRRVVGYRAHIRRPQLGRVVHGGVTVDGVEPRGVRAQRAQHDLNAAAVTGGGGGGICFGDQQVDDVLPCRIAELRLRAAQRRVGRHVHGGPAVLCPGQGRGDGIHYLHRIGEHLFQRGVDLRVTPERHLLQRLLLRVAGEINGVAYDGQILPVGLRAVAGGILHGDLVVQTRYHAVQLSGEAAVVALRGCALDGHLSRADNVLRSADDAGKAAGVVRAGNVADAVAVLHRAVAGAHKTAGMAAAGNSTAGMAVIDVAAAFAHQSAGGRGALDRAAGGGLGYGTVVPAHQAAGHFRTADLHIGGALIYRAGDGEQCVLIRFASVQAHQSAHVFLTRHLAAHRAAADQVRHVLGQIIAVQLHLGVAHQSAHILLAGDLHVHQLQVADGRALDGVEEAYVHPVGSVDGHIGNGAALPIEHPGKGIRRAADTAERRACQIQIVFQPVVLAQCLGICGIRQLQQVVHRFDVHPANGGGCAGQLLPGRPLEAIFSGALKPQHLIAVLHCGKRCADVGQRIIDGKHPAVRRVHLMTVDGVDESPEGAGGSIAVGQQTLPLRLVHQIHQTGVAVAVHGDGDHVAHAVKGIAVLVVGGDGQLDGDFRRHRRLRHGNAQQIGQSAVLIRRLSPHAADTAGDSRQEAAGSHLVQGLARSSVSLSRRGGKVEVAVRDALGLVVLERGIGLVAADEAVALLAADGNDACGIAVLIGVAAVHRATHKATGIASGVDITQREAVFDGTAVAQTHEAAGVLAGGIHRHAGPAAFDLAAGLVGAHKAGVPRSRQAVGGQRAALHIAAADDAVVAADHTAQHRAGVGGDIGVHHGALFHAAVVVMHQHCRVVGEQHVGALNGQIVDIRRSAGVPEQAAVIVAEGQSGDRMPLSVELAHKGIGDPADGLGFGLLRRRQLGEVNILRQAVVLAPLHLLPVGGIGTPGGLVLHIGQLDPLCRAGDVHPLLGAGVLLALVGVVHIAVRGGDAVGQAQLLQQALVTDGRNGEGVLLPRRKGVGEVGGGIVPRQRKRLEVGVDRICTLARHRVEVDAISAAEVLPAVPLGRCPLPAEAGHRRHAVVGLLIADDPLLRRLYVAAHRLAVCLLRHGGIVHAVAPCGEPSGQVVLPAGDVGDVLHEGQLGLVSTQLLRRGQTDDKRCAALHGLIQTLARHVLRVVLRRLHSGVQLGKLRPLFLAHAADDRRCVHIFQLLQAGEVGGFVGDAVIFRQTVRIQRCPAAHHLPEGNGVGPALRRVPQQQAGGQGGYVAVVGVELLPGETDILRHGHRNVSGFVRLPLQNRIAVVDAANGLPVARTQLFQLFQQLGTIGDGGGIVGFCPCGNAARQIEAVFCRIAATGSKRACI